MEALLPTEIIKAEALRLGFSACGAAPAEAVSEKVADTFRKWLICRIMRTSASTRGS